MKSYKYKPKESYFVTDFFKALKNLLPGCTAFKNDSSYVQGIPDWIVIYKDKYAMLEFKRSKDEDHQPNQDYYVDYFNKQAYATFCYPENAARVMTELLNYLKGEANEI